ncbi:MAG: multidrug transporter [Mucilaginibacter sp.]|nr:multidrug transporter [Mucilaginibacter sp.]
MKTKMNESAPLPITMDDSKFKAGTRDVIFYNDAKIPGSLELKDVFDFITSDNKQVMAQMQSGEEVNYLPTKNFRLSINPDQVISTGTLSADKKAQIDTVLNFTYPGAYVTKDNLALMDVLAHNNWKRPIYFAVSVPSDNFMGLNKYLYNEGFAYRLLPLKPDTAAAASESGQANSVVMYNNLMNKFKWGNLKTAKYLDDVSLTQMFPLITRSYLSLIDNLRKEGRADLAKNALAKYREVTPDIIPAPEIAWRQFYMAKLSYELGQTDSADKEINKIADYINNSLAYNYLQFKDGKPANNNQIRFSLSLLNQIVTYTKTYNPALSEKWKAPLDHYIKDFGATLQY